MSQIIAIAGWILFSLFILSGIGFIITSLLEYKKRPALLAAAIFLPGTLILYQFMPGSVLYSMWILGGLVLFAMLLFVVMLLPIGPHFQLRITGDQKRIDERSAIFHRFYRLKPGMEEFDLFYSEHPEFKEIDEEIRSMPGLDMEGSETYNQYTTPFNVAIFDVMKMFFRGVEQTESIEGRGRIPASPELFAEKIKGFSRYLGADLVGITGLNPAYIYSHIGRSPGEWGSEIICDHSNAIVLAVEMDYEMVRHAPHHISTTETSFKYYKAGQAALALSKYIQMMGYRSRAHVDGNYRVLCGPIAADAGLGELGRLGLLITPEFGPRVRLAVVTTDMPLAYDKPIEFGVQDFCEFCKKCAVNCPSAAISKKEKTLVNGVEKWQSNQEACFKYWHRVGSDCSICLKVCPYSHPDTLLHTIMRFFIKRNGPARRLALLMDDFFYGRRPKTTFPFPEWHRPV